MAQGAGGKSLLCTGCIWRSAVAGSSGRGMDTMAEMKMLAVCAREEGYGIRLAEYARNQNSCPFRVQAFSTVETLGNYLKLRNVDAILLDEGMYEEDMWQKYDGVLCLLGNGVGQEENPPQIFKYQPARDILNGVLAQYLRGAEQQENQLVNKKGMEIFGIYSPVGRCGKSLFSLALGLELARHQKTLYLNLESWSGLNQGPEEAPGGSLSDLLYFLRQRRGALPEFLSSIVRNADKLDMISPVRAPADLASVSVEDWQYLFEALRRQSSYEAVVLDIGDSPQPIERLLSICTKVYVPTLSDRDSRIKLGRFLEFIEAAICQELAPEIEHLSLPLVESIGMDRSWAEQVLWSDMGDFVRRILRK